MMIGQINAQTADLSSKGWPTDNFTWEGMLAAIRRCPRGSVATVLRHRQALESTVKFSQVPSRCGAHHRMYILVDTMEAYFGENSNSDASAMGQQLGSANSVF